MKILVVQRTKEFYLTPSNLKQAQNPPALCVKQNSVTSSTNTLLLLFQQSKQDHPLCHLLHIITSSIRQSPPSTNHWPTSRRSFRAHLNVCSCKKTGFWVATWAWRTGTCFYTVICCVWMDSLTKFSILYIVNNTVINGEGVKE